MSEPGDRAPKSCSLRESTQSQFAEDHGVAPIRVEMAPTLPSECRTHRWRKSPSAPGNVRHLVPAGLAAPGASGLSEDGRLSGSDPVHEVSDCHPPFAVSGSQGSLCWGHVGTWLRFTVSEKPRWLAND